MDTFLLARRRVWLVRNGLWRRLGSLWLHLCHLRTLLSHEACATRTRAIDAYADYAIEEAAEVVRK